MSTILVTGANGQVGWELRRTLLPLGRVVPGTRPELDLASPDAIRRCVRDVRPDLIVNAGAYTAVDRAESEREIAHAVNGVAPGILAEEARARGIPLVHYSTDYVFDGSRSGPYDEDDAPNPLNVYGRTKLAGEAAIRQVGARHLILRTSWVYGARGKNFLLTIRRLARERDTLSVVADQIGAPTWSRAIAEATAQILAQRWINAPADAFDTIGGTYHLSAAGTTSWYDFARAIVRAAPRVVSVNRITTADYAAPAARPKNSLLSNAKLARVFGIAIGDWQAQLDLCLEELG